MDIRSELASAIKSRYEDVYGVGPSPKTKNQLQMPKQTSNETISKREQSSRSAAKKAASEALAAKMGKKSSRLGSPKASSKNRNAPMSIKKVGLVQKYRKMMNMGLSEGAVRHKMVSDGVSERVINAVLSGETIPMDSSVTAKSNGSTGAGGTLTPKEEKIAAQYRTMLKVKMPEGAVRHKMTADGVSTKIQEAVMAGNAAPVNRMSEKKEISSVKSSSKSLLSPEEETIASQYRTMLKVKMPEGAVRHKMVADGVSIKIQESVLNGDVAPASSSESISTPSSGKSTEMISSLSASDEVIATQYRKMIKMRIPEGAVKYKMEKDGVPSHIQDSVLRHEIPAHNHLKTEKDDKAASESMATSRPSSNPMADAIASSGGIGGLKKTSPKSKENIPPSPPSNPLAAAIAASGGKGSLKKTPVQKKDVAPTPASSNPLAAAIAASGGKAALKKTPVQKKDVSPTPAPSNPLAAAIAASGGKGSLKKTPVQKKDVAPTPAPSNPLAAAIAASGGKAALKKTPVQKKDVSPTPAPSNPLAAAIAASGGKAALKKTPVQKKDVSPTPAPSNPLAAAIAASGGKAALKKTPVKDVASTSEPSNPLAAALAASGGQSGLRKTTPIEKTEKKPTSTGNSLMDELFLKGFKSGLKKAPQKSEQEPPKANDNITGSQKGSLGSAPKPDSPPRETNQSSQENAKEISPASNMKDSKERYDSKNQEPSSLPVAIANDRSKKPGSAYLRSFTSPSLQDVPIEYPYKTSNNLAPETYPSTSTKENQSKESALHSESKKTVDSDFKRNNKKIPNSKKKGKSKSSVVSGSGVEYHCRQCSVM